MSARPFFPILAAAFLLIGCSGGSGHNPDPPFQVVTAKDLEGAYTGVLERITVPSLNALKNTTQHTLVSIDLLHQVNATAKGDLHLVLQSSAIPKTDTLMAGIGSVAINLAFIEFEGLAGFPQNAEIHYLQVQNVLFVKYLDEWIMVLQIARVGYPGDQGLNGVYVYQYVSYPSSVTGQMTQNEAVQYVNTILKLAGST